MELRLKSKDVNAVSEFATTDADNRCTTSLFKTNYLRTTNMLTSTQIKLS